MIKFLFEDVRVGAMGVGDRDFFCPKEPFLCWEAG